jgi:GNAT superfamily N-acetyltransferase
MSKVKNPKAKFIEEADADNDSNVFIDGVQSSLYLQSMTLDQIENDPALKMIAEQAQEAARLGGDVVLPVADFATSLTGTAHFEALRPHMTLSAETISPFRQEQQQTENQNYVQKIMEEAQQSTTQLIEAQSIYDSVRIQLIDTGMVNAQNANTMSQLVPAWATVYAKDNGLTVEEVYQNSGLTIEGPQTGEAARLAGDVLEQSPVDFQATIKAEFPDVNLSITGKGNTVTLNKIIVPEDQREAGTGSAVMQRVIEWADTNNKTIALTPSKDFGGTVKRLKEFYKRYGFVDNKGKNKDFEISEAMFREPSELLAQPTEAGGARGYYDPSNSVIRLTEAADLSTFLHEFAHFMYEMEVKADGDTLQDINKWFKRNAFDVAAEANVYLDKAGADLKQSAVDNSGVLEQAKAKGFDGEVISEAVEFLQAVEKGLDMSTAARLKRAEEMGFDTDTIWYHTSKEEEVITSIGENTGRFGGIFALPGYSAEYGETTSKFYLKSESIAEDSDIEALVYEHEKDLLSDYEWLTDDIDSMAEWVGRFENIPADVVDDSYADLQRIRGELARKGGFSATTIDDEFDGDTVLILGGEGVRSVNAAFDPDFKESSDLLAQQPVDKTAQIEKSIKESERQITKLEKSETVGRLISSKGGLNRESMEAEGVDPSNFKQRGKVFGKPLFPAKGGLTADGVAEALSEIKFNGKTYTANEALPIIEAVLAGKDPFTNADVSAEIQSLQEDISSLENQLEENQAELQRAFDLRAELEALQSIADSATSDRPELQDITEREAAERIDIEQGFSGLVTTADVKAFLDNGTTGIATKDSAIRTAVHEQFARGFETYLMEGKAPSPELRNAFATFARWLTSIYRNLRDSLKVNLDADMRQVYDRLLTTEEQVAAASGRARHEPMFTDADMAGMTDEEFSAYEKSVGKTKDKQTETLRDKLIKELTRTTTKQWNEEKRGLIDQEIERLKDEQVYATAEQLRTGEIKLDRATVKSMIGEQVTDLGVTSTVIPPALRKMTVTKGGMHPDQASVFFGYSSGSAMLSDLITAPKIQVQAEVNAEKAMIEKHGNILTDGTIEQQADEAVQSEERGKLILTELKALSRGTNQPAMERQTVKALAKEEIGKLSFRENQPAKYRKAEIRAAQEAATALANDDKVGAASAKARQVMNYYLAIEATKAKNETAKIVDRMTRYRKKKVREEIIKAENGYWEQISKILSRFEFRKAASLFEVDAVNENISAWAAERIKEHGDGLIISPATMNEMFTTHWKNVTFNDLQGISDTVKNIEHVARYGNKIRLEDEKREFQQIVDEWVDHINKQPTVFTPQRTTTTENKSWLRAGMAQMTKIPFLASWLDGGERVGLSHDLLMSEINDASKREQDLWKEFGDVVMTAIENRSKDDQNRHLQKIFIPEIKSDLDDGNLTGGQVLAVALNTGNEGNLRKMLLGEGWANPKNEDEISIDNPQLQSVLQHMTKKDWELVQLVWDQMEAIYPHVEEVHKRTTGLVPPRVEAVPVKTPFGTFKGGYYPVKYDHNRSSVAARNKDRADAQVDSMFGESLSIQASVNTGTINARTGVYGPINLNLDVIPNHFQETIHYVTHHVAVRQVNKLINNDKVRSAIIAKLGQDEYAQLKPWLNDIAKDGKSAPPKTFIDATFDRLRMGVTLGVMGFKASTGIIQVSGIFNTYAEVGSKHVHKAMRTVYGRGLSSIQDSTEFAFEHSNVMENRTKTMDREIKNALKKLEGKRGVLPILQEASMKHIAFIQFYGADLLSWHAAYTSKLEETGDLERSYKYADWVVENVQGSGATKDMATLFRNQSKTHTTFTMFMTFFSSLWNMERDAVRGAKSGRYSASTLAAKAMFMFTLPVLFEMLMRDEVDFEDEDLAEKTLTKLALFPIASVPFVRDVASGIGSVYGYTSSPVAANIDRGLSGIKSVANAMLSDEEIKKGAAKGATKFIGAAFGVPGVSQAWATGEHLFDVIEEGEELTLHQLLFGPKRD